MNDFFDSNLSFLEQYDPQTAERLRFSFPTDPPEIFMTPSGAPSMRVRLDGRSHLIHSERDPMREAERWVSTLSYQSPINLMVLGCGMMHHAYQLVMRYQKTLRNLVIVDRSLDVLYAAFQHVDLSPYLRTQTTFFLGEYDEHQIRDFFNNRLTPFCLDGLEIIRHPASCEIDPAYYDGVERVARESLQNGEILLRTKVQLGGMIQENIVRNLPLMLNNPNVSALQGLYMGTPAFVVGAGPSLDRNIDWLAQIGERGVLIASDTVFRLLRERGANPHIVVSTDPTYLNARHFEGVEELGDTALVFTPSLYYEAARQLQGVKVSIPLPASRFLKTLEDALGPPNIMPPGINVGQTCFNLARLMGCDPIVLVGMDFSFPKEGGHTHVSGTALRRVIKPAATPGKMQVELIADPPEWEEFDPIMIPGALGGDVATNKFWLAYLRSMEEEIRKTSARVINATEGGALIVGAETRPLGDTIRELCVNDVMTTSTMQMAVGFYFGAHAPAGESVLKESLNILKTARKHLEEGMKSVQALEKVLDSISPSPQLIHSLIQDVRRCHREAIQDQKLYIVLDEASDRVLAPFIKREGRPEGESPDPVNARRTVERFGRYFEEMLPLCETYTLIMEETLEVLQSPDFGFPSF